MAPSKTYWLEFTPYLQYTKGDIYLDSIDAYSGELISTKKVKSDVVACLPMDYNGQPDGIVVIRER